MRAKKYKSSVPSRDDLIWPIPRVIFEDLTSQQMIYFRHNFYIAIGAYHSPGKSYQLHARFFPPVRWRSMKPPSFSSISADGKSCTS